MQNTLEFSGLTKSYGGVTVLSNVSLRLEPGRVHALMGENGAGKSTLIKLLAGVIAADSLVLRKNGQDIPLRSAADAAAAGFRIIHQELNLVPQLSVAENILLGQPIPRRFGFLVNWPEVVRRARAALRQLGADTINVTQAAGRLSAGDRMLVKIASALVCNDGEATPCLYVLDEPTAALSEAEAEKLFDVIARLKTQGAAILYVSHRLNEVIRICDDVTVLRNGQQVITAEISQTTREDIILQMTGRQIADSYPPQLVEIGDKIICQALSVNSSRLSNLNFTLRPGEILGVSGLVASGQTDLLRLFLGLERPLEGQLTLTDTTIPESPNAAWAKGVAYVPQERRTEGLMMRMGTRPNALLSHYKGLRARRRQEQARAVEISKRIGLKSGGPEQSVWRLSGGNQQKVVFARAIAGNPRLLLLDDPTRGVDVGAKFEIYTLMRQLSAKGCGILLSSTDLPELLGMCDRILVLQAGRQSDILNPAGMTPSDLLRAFYATTPISETS